MQCSHCHCHCIFTSFLILSLRATQKQSAVFYKKPITVAVINNIPNSSNPRPVRKLEQRRGLECASERVRKCRKRKELGDRLKRAVEDKLYSARKHAFTRRGCFWRSKDAGSVLMWLHQHLACHLSASEPRARMPRGLRPRKSIAAAAVAFFVVPDARGRP